MIETPHQTKSTEPTPEQLLQLLDLQITSQRAKRKGGRKNRPLILVCGLFFILAGALAALFVLQQMAGDLRQQRETPFSEVSVRDSQ